MWLDEVEKLSKKQLRVLINESFAAAEKEGLGQYPQYQRAEFFMRELEHRRDSRISIRDFLLEIVVIGMIGWEIWMGYQTEHSQNTNFEAQKLVLDNMKKSSEATAGSLIAAQQVLENMNGALQKQLALFYDVSVILVFDSDKKLLHFWNDGRTNVSIWGLDVGVVPFTRAHEGRVVVPGGGYQEDGTGIYNFVTSRFPKPAEGLVPFKLYVKNERNEEFIVHGYFAMHWENNIGRINVQIGTIVPERWGRTEINRDRSSKKAP